MDTLSQDNLRDDLVSAFSDSEDKNEPELQETDDNEKTGSRDRDDFGRFTSKVDPDEKTAQESVEPVPVVPVDDSVNHKDYTRAPSSWKKSAAEHFSSLPPEIQEEIHRRESDFHNGYGKQFEESETYRQIAPLAEKGRQYDDIANRYEKNYENHGISSVQAVEELFKSDHLLRHAPPAVKMQKLVDMAGYYGIDMNQQFAPEVAKMQQRMYDLEQQNHDILTNQQMREMQAATSEIHKFANSPGHEHFENVRGHMKSLLEGGMANDLQDAYDQAIYANPETRRSLLEQQIRAEQERTNMKRAQSAAVSVKGSTPASGSSKPASNSLREDIISAFNQN